MFAASPVPGLHAGQCTIAIDDFGTGYSSLDYLGRLLQALELDRAFLAEVESDGNDAAISIATLAHSLGLRVVAEGVETVGQRDLMVAHDCHHLQGNLVGRPAPAAFWSAKRLAERNQPAE